MRKVILSILMLSGANVFASADLYIYPNNGQGPELQGRDRYECHVWAAQQTGFDPSTYQAPQPVHYPAHGKRRHAGRPDLNPVTGAAGGAALGAVGGAIGGDAGKGAAIGAGVGAVVGAFQTLTGYGERQDKKHKYYKKVAAYEQQVAEAEELRQDYNRAISACLEGRGYTVK